MLLTIVKGDGIGQTGVAVGVGESVGVNVLVAVGVLVFVGEGVGVKVLVAVGVSVWVGEDVGVNVLVVVGAPVFVVVGVGVSALVAIGVSDWVAEAVDVRVAVGVRVIFGICVSVEVGEEVGNGVVGSHSSPSAVETTWFVSCSMGFLKQAEMYGKNIKPGVEAKAIFVGVNSACFKLVVSLNAEKTSAKLKKIAKIIPKRKLLFMDLSQMNLMAQDYLLR